MARVLDLVERILLQISSAMFLLIVILTLVQVFFRYVLNDALSWSAEFTRIVFVWMSFLGSAVAVNRTRHMRIDTIINLLPKRWRLIVDILVHAAMAVFLLTVSYYAIDLVENTTHLVTGALRWPRTVFFLPVLLGCALMLVYCLRVIHQDYRQLAAGQEV